MAKKSGKTSPKRAPAKTAKKPIAAKKAVAKKPRKVKPAQYKSFRLHKRIKHRVKISNIYQLSRQAFSIVWENKKLFAGITLIYGLLNLLLVQGIAGSQDLGSLKNTLDQLFSGNFGALASSLSVFAVLVSSAGSSADPTGSAYQLFLGLIGSLAIIWALRQVLAGNKIRIRDPYYRGIYPLVPFVIVLLVVGLQLIPLLIGSSLYSLVINNGIAVYAAEKFVWALLYAALALLSFYMLSSSLFALYIVTLPDMTPMKALRSARELVRHRRWTVLRKILALPVILLIIAAAIMLPIIIWLTPLAQWIFFILTMSVLLAVHTYMYTLYRELLNE